MKKFMFVGADPEVSEESTRQALAPLGPLGEVTILRAGSPEVVLVIAELDVSDEKAFELISKPSNPWHDGRRVRVHLMLH